MDKKRIVKDYEALPEEVINRLKMEYPYGFAQNLISFTNKEGKRISALPFETEDIYYLIRMTSIEAEQIIEDDEDYDNEGNLRDDFSVSEADAEIAEDSSEEEETDGYADHDAEDQEDEDKED